MDKEKPAGGAKGGKRDGEREFELAHFTGRLYEHAGKLLAQEPNYYLEPDAQFLPQNRAKKHYPGK